jgi:hypothetical protein
MAWVGLACSLRLTPAGPGSGTALAPEECERRCQMYSILYIIGAIVVIIVLLRLLGLY